jgi:hypothetical protein
LRNTKTIKPAAFFPWTGPLAGIAYYVYMLLHNLVPADTGDGIQHFGYAQNAWREPAELLSHWGKPLFTLLSMPFAQAGYNAYIGFNILVFALTCLFAGLLFRKLKVSGAYTFFFPLLLVSVPDYSSGVLGGMTEPLFGMLTVTMLLAGYTRKWIVFALIASFLPFSRSEGMLAVLLALPVLLYHRQWKALPFLLAGFVIYGIAGLSVYDTFWWYFTEDPYTGYMIYGHGEWNHFLLNRQYVNRLIILLIIPGLFGWFVYRRQKDGPDAVLFLFSVALFAGVVVIHSYLWAKGLKGSLGLTRVGTLGLPAFLAVMLIGTDRVTRELHILSNAVLFTALSLGIVYKISKFPYPLQPNAFEQIVIRSVDHTRENLQRRHVFYYHPLVSWRFGARIRRDPNIHFISFNRDTVVLQSIPDSSIIIRDPQFGPAEQGLPPDFIESRKELRLLRVIRAKSPYQVYTGEPVEMRIYEYRSPAAAASVN